MKLGYSGADMAGFLGINTYVISRLAVSSELPEAGEHV